MYTNLYYDPNYEEVFKQAKKAVFEAFEEYKQYILGRIFLTIKIDKLRELEKVKNSRNEEYKKIAERYLGYKIGNSGYEN